jgi:hypothetical protein
MTCWVESPARTSLKLFATGVAACRRVGISDPGRHLVFIRSWNTATIIVARSRLSDAQVQSARKFCEQRWFDLCYLPDMRESEANRFIVLERPEHFEFADRLLRTGERDAYAKSLFYLEPATDDCPYFFRFVRWRGLPSLFRQFGLRWMPAVEWGYITLVATLLQGSVLAALLILLPVFLFASRPGLRGAKSRVIWYFGVLGCAYMFLEIACIQRFTLYLAHPVYAVTVTLATFLVVGGVGSLAAQQALARGRVWVRYAVLGIALAASLYIAALGPIFTITSGWGFFAKALLSVLLLSPLAFCMGMPFPIGMQRVSDACPELVPWAWAVNGSLSVVGALLATLVAVHLGIRSVMLAAVLAYLTILPLQRKFPGATVG